MALYQHSAHCSSAMQWFLDENPDYWPFVPVENGNDANNEDPNSDTTMSFNYADHVPEPPLQYRFTSQQKKAINQFFRDKKYLKSPNPHLDLYHATIIALCKSRFYAFESDLRAIAVPIHASDALRRFVEALFITHTEAKLNTDGHLDALLFPDAMAVGNDSGQQNDPWCKHLVRRHP